MAIHQEGTPPPPPPKKPTLEDGILLSVRTDRVKVKGAEDGTLKVEIKEEDESIYMDDNNNLHINLDAGRK